MGDLVWRGAMDRVTLRPNRDLRVEGLRLASGSQRLEGHGTIRFHGPEDLEAELQDFDLTALQAIFGRATPEVAGHADAHLVLKGDIAHPNLTFEGALRHARIGGIDGIDAVYVVTYDNGHLGIDSQIELGSRGSLSLSGTGTLDPSIADPVQALAGGVYDMQLQVTDLDLGLVHDVAGDRVPPISGRVAGAITASGPIEAPSFEGHLSVPALTLPGWPSLGAQTSFRYQNGALVGRLITKDGHTELAEVEGSTLIDLVNLIRHPSQAVASLGTFPWRFSLRVPPRTVAAMPAPVRDRIPDALQPLLVSLSATFAGGGFETQGDLHAGLGWTGDLSHLPCGANANPRAELDAILENGTTTVKARGFVADKAAVVLTASAPTPLNQWLEDIAHVTPPPITADVHLDQANLGKVPYLCEVATGTTSGTIGVRDLGTDRPRAHAHLQSSTLRVYGSSALAVDVDTDLTATALDAHGRIGPANAPRSQVSVHLPFRWNRAHPVPALADDGNMAITASFDAAPLQPLLGWLPDVVGVQGTVTGHVGIRGPIGSPEWSGEANVKHGYVEVMGIGQQLSDVQGRLVLHSHEVRLDHFVAHDVEGTLTVDGSVAMAGLAPDSAHLVVDSDKFPVRREGSILASLTGRATVDADVGAHATTAHVRVAQLDVRLPDESTRTVQDLAPHQDVHVVGRSTESTTGSSRPYELHVLFDATDTPFWVRRNDFSAQAVASLDALYRDPDFFVRGYVELRRGFFEVFGKRFDVDRGTMSFDGQADINPVVALQATHHLRGANANQTVTVSVTGRLATPSVTFRSSVPSCQEKGEIIQLLLSGQCGGQQEAGQVGNEATAGQQAVSFLSGLAAGILTVTARRELGGLLPVIVIEQGDSALSYRMRAGWQADSIIPKFLRGAVRGAYVEGYFTTQDPNQPSSAGSGSTSRAGDNGVLLELSFPYNIVNTWNYSPPSSWGVDVTWEP